jgi:poly-beta-1,6-N-acetyl-D-glucosamine biosynthesis protein PgaD
MKPHPIIERPELQTARQRFGGLLVTVTAWAAWLYLWMPATLVTTVSSLRHRLLMPDALSVEADGYWTGALLYGCLCCVCGFVLVSWTFLDTLRNRGRQRPQPARPTNPAELAQDFGVMVQLVSRAQRARNLVFHFHQDGRIENIEMRQPPLFEEERMAG